MSTAGAILFNYATLIFIYLFPYLWSAWCALMSSITWNFDENLLQCKTLSRFGEENLPCLRLSNLPRFVISDKCLEMKFDPHACLEP